MNSNSVQVINSKISNLIKLLLSGMLLIVFLFSCQGEKGKIAGGNLIDKIDVSRGICIVLGDSTGDLAIDLATGLSTDLSTDLATGLAIALAVDRPIDRPTRRRVAR